MFIGSMIQKIKGFAVKIATLNGTPRGIAFGFSLGLFMSVIPTFGVGMIAALALASVFKANFLAAYLGTLVVNPVTGVFFYGFNYLIGSWILGGEAGLALPRSFSELWPLLGTIGKQLYLGGLILASALSALSYLAVFNAVRIYRKRKERRR